MAANPHRDRDRTAAAPQISLGCCLLWLSLGCGCSPAGPAHSVAPSSVPTPIAKQGTGANQEPQREVRELLVERRYLRQDANKGLVVFEPDSDRQRATYEHYVFADDEWARVVTNASAPGWTKLRVRVEVLDEQATQSTPEPNMPSPDGGFRHVQIQCRPLQVVPEP